MALRKLLSKRFYDGCREIPKSSSLEHSPLSTLPAASIRSTAILPPPNAAKPNFTSPESSLKGIFRRFLHRRAINEMPEFLSLPVGEKLREKLKGINLTEERLRLGEVSPPYIPVNKKSFGISVEDARKLLRISQLEKLKARLTEIPNSSILYPQFLQICVKECGNEDQGTEFAKMLDQCGNVIVLGNIVFLRPDQVAKSIENIIPQSIATPNDPRRKQLEHMDMQKAFIDQQAKAQVKKELYYGLGLMMAQTLGFMRLTFWELSWDVMEPICFFVTSIHFALAYVFFLRTSVEPSFEGYFQRRFKSKQKKLMQIHNFDVEKYNQLRKAFYPSFSDNFPCPQVPNFCAH
ncbi:calcium uniporter protein 4, mitochondrial [Mercurialis annua]|uniref:calcium uniporter protein 4, mitochondrial n=1 Tax=Mercurialis annua TaxID=3986 RepID=UPI00215EE18F|nr:calcium uniporter protein 4, mitochondrial [Mercurialis annua]